MPKEGVIKWKAENITVPEEFQNQIEKSRKQSKNVYL